MVPLLPGLLVIG